MGIDFGMKKLLTLSDTTEVEYKTKNNVIYSCKYNIVWTPKYRRKVKERIVSVHNNNFNGVRYILRIAYNLCFKITYKSEIKISSDENEKLVIRIW